MERELGGISRVVGKRKETFSCLKLIIKKLF